MYNVLIVDDHAIVRHGLTQILARTCDMRVGGEASTGQQAIDMVKKDGWDVVVLDISLPGKTGIEVLKELRRIRSSLPILILSMHAEDQYAIRALKAGANGYLTKQAAPKELIKAIRKLVSGGRYVTESLAEKLAGEFQTDSSRLPHERLSDREYEVFKLIGSGKTVSQIADTLAISVQTVSTHRRRILDKMGMSTNAELTHYAILNKLAD